MNKAKKNISIYHLFYRWSLIRISGAGWIPAIALLACACLFVLGCHGHDPAPPAPAEDGPSSIPKPEHPRPDFQRDLWLNLNGWWDFAYDPQDRGEKEQWYQSGRETFDKRILVPFPWESPASGLGRAYRGEASPEDLQTKLTYRGVAWYRRSFRVPTAWDGRRIFIRFGAVDWSCRVWVNGVPAGAHEGGYSPFAFDITDLLAPGGNTLVVRVFDPSDLDPQIPRGKQGGIWYSRCSGIWQTVYLEALPSCYLKSIHAVPDPEESSVRFLLRIVNGESSGPYDLRFAIQGPDEETIHKVLSVECMTGASEHRVTIPLVDQHLWCPEDPFLYYVRVCLEPARGGPADCVRTYFGQRRVETDWAPGRSPRDGVDMGEQYKYVYLNGKPLYIRGLLDQSYHPDGIYTYPDEESLKKDLLLARDAGFNCLRIHIKIDEPRRLYWADRLGLLVMSDIPCPGQYAINTADSRCRPLWEETLRAAVERDFNHPSIWTWCDFNETWGLTLPLPLLVNPGLQSWVRRMWTLTKELDPTRLVEDNSPTDFFRDHVITDINSWHFYRDDYWEVREHLDWVDRNVYPGSPEFFVGRGRQDGAPLICSEFGPLSAWGGDRDISWGLKYQVNELRRHAKICGYVYTELTDIEWERNGLFRYDRSPKEFGYDASGIALQDLSGADFLTLSSPPAETVAPGAEFRTEAAVSYYSSERAPSDPMLRWRFWGTDRLGETVEPVEGGPLPITVNPYALSAPVSIARTLPEIPMAGTLLVWSESPIEGWQVKNFLQLDLYDGQPERVESLADGRWALRFDPGDYTDSCWDEEGPLVAGTDGGEPGETLWGYDEGFVEYEVALPEEVSPESIEKIELRIEVSSARGPFNRQTDVSPDPSHLAVYLNDSLLETYTIPDGPADTRGFLSHLHPGDQPLHGSYGYLLSMETTRAVSLNLIDSLGQERILRLRFDVRPGPTTPAGGLRIYGDRLGRYVIDPTLLVTVSSP